MGTNRTVAYRSPLFAQSQHWVAHPSSALVYMCPKSGCLCGPLFHLFGCTQGFTRVQKWLNGGSHHLHFLSCSGDRSATGYRSPRGAHVCATYFERLNSLKTLERTSQSRTGAGCLHSVSSRARNMWLEVLAPCVYAKKSFKAVSVLSVGFVPSPPPLKPGLAVYRFLQDACTGKGRGERGAPVKARTVCFVPSLGCSIDADSTALAYFGYKA